MEQTTTPSPVSRRQNLVPRVSSHSDNNTVPMRPSRLTMMIIRQFARTYTPAPLSGALIAN